MANVEKEIEALRSEIEHHNDLYYQKEAPEISDYEFDQLLERLTGIYGVRPTFEFVQIATLVENIRQA